MPSKPPADGGTRTHTPLTEKRILSPLRLPFRHIGLENIALCMFVLQMPEKLARNPNSSIFIRE